MARIYKEARLILIYLIPVHAETGAALEFLHQIVGLNGEEFESHPSPLPDQTCTMGDK